MTRRHRRRDEGYTLVEVMMALGILAVGATGILGLQMAAIRGNQEANEFATATRTVEFWLDRYRMDALSWRTGGRGTTVDATTFANTEYFRMMPPGGSTGWGTPPAAGAGSFPSADQLSFHGNPQPAPGSPLPVFCTQSNLTWVYAGTAIRVDVRTYWQRRTPSAAAGALACPRNPTSADYHFVHGSTLVRWTPELRR